jgi:hypothetical protein
MSKRKNEVPHFSNVDSVHLTEEIIRSRAYELFEQRGSEPGHELEDWLQAEAEVIGKKAITRADQSTRLHRVGAA